MSLNYRRPGVYLEETPFNNPPTEVGGSQSAAVFVGAAEKGPIAEAVRIESWSDYNSRYGGFNKIVNVSGGPASRNQVYVSRPGATSLNEIENPRLGDICFANDYRYTSERFFLHNSLDLAASASGYSDPHDIYIFCGAALGWRNTGFQFHTENGFFGSPDNGEAYAATDLPNPIRGANDHSCNFFMSTSAGNVPSFSGSPQTLDIGLHWNTTEDRWSLWMYGHSNYWFGTSGVDKGDFQGGGLATYTPFTDGVWKQIDLTTQQTIQTSAAPIGADWGLLTSNDSVETSGREEYISLQDMPGDVANFQGVDWSGWSPDLSGPTGSTVSALPYLPYAVNSFFQNGGRTAWVIRAVSSDEAGTVSSTNYTTEASGGDTCFTVEATGAGVWGDDLSVNIAAITTDQGQEIFTVRVLLNGVEVERFPNCTMVGSIPGTKRLDLAINDPALGSRYIAISAFDDQSTPILDAGNTPRDLSGGSDPNLPSSLDLMQTAANTVTTIDGALLVNIVGHTTNASDPSAFVYPTAVTSTQIVGNSGRRDIFVVNDACPPRPARKLSRDYMAQEIQSTLTSASTTDSYVASYTPWIVVPDPAVPGGTLATPPGGAIMGVMARIDATTGVFRSPAGIPANIVNAVGVDTKFTDSELGELNQDHVNVIRSIQGAGMCIMGARTRKKYGVDMYIAPRRTLIYIEETLKRATQFGVFENNDQRLWAKLQMTADRILRPLWTAGGLMGNSTAEAYFIKCDATINTPAVVNSGEVRMEIGVALAYPAEFVVITVSQYDGTTFTQEVQPS